jgi:CcmD family protein
MVLGIGMVLMTMAQTADKPIEMATMMRSNGKIYVVVAVLATIFAGLFLYLFRLEKNIKKLEKE